jgi:hypothetical protein
MKHTDACNTLPKGQTYIAFNANIKSAQNYEKITKNVP